MTAGAPQRPERRLGSWILERELGAGAFGKVFVARHESHPEIRRAVKWLATSDETAVARFRRECELLARLRVPGIVSIHEVGRSGSDAWSVMDLVPGRTLRRVLEEEAPAGFPLDRAVSIAAAVSRAVAAAHEAGVLHRDLKPENVLVTPEGEVRVVDFGLATASEVERLTRSGAFLGTVGYVAPEMIRGQKVGAPADVYSLGVLFHELLTGHRLHEGGTALAALDAALAGRHEPPSAKRPELPAWVDAVFERAVALDPAARFPDAGAFAAALEKRDAGPGGVRRRGRARAVGVAVLVGLAVAGGAVKIALGVRARARAHALARSVASLEASPVDAATLDRLRAERAALDDAALDSRARASLDDALRRVAQRVALHGSDERASLEAALDLLRESDPARLAPDDLAAATALVVARWQADPGHGSSLLEPVLRGKSGPLVQRALVHRAVESALSAGAPEERRAALRRARAVDSHLLVRELEAWGREAAPGEPGRLEAAIDFGRAVLELGNPRVPEVRARLAVLLLARCEALRRSDPAGALEARREAGLLAPELESPPWYPGFVQRLVREADDSGERGAALRERALAETAAEDAGWILPIEVFARITALGESPGTGGIEREIARGYAQLLMQDFPWVFSLPLPPFSGTPPPPRLEALHRALARVSGNVTEVGAPGDLGSIGDVLTACRAARSAHDGTLPAGVEEWLAAAFERQRARAGAVEAALAAAPEDEDLRAARAIALVRAAHVRAVHALLLLGSARDVLDGAGPSPGREALGARTRALMDEAADLCPGDAPRRLLILSRRCQALGSPKGLGLPREVVAEVKRIEASEPLFQAVVAHPERSSIQSVIAASEILLLGALSRLEVVPVDLAGSDRAFAEARRLRGYGGGTAHDNEFDDFSARIEELRKQIGGSEPRGR